MPLAKIDGVRQGAPDGATAEIWTMHLDGSQPRQITHLGVMSWAPYFHPSGAYVVFTANKLGFDNFELFLVDATGLREPARVTFTEGFDGLPVFSPDGQRILTASADKTARVFRVVTISEIAELLAK